MTVLMTPSARQASAIVIIVFARVAQKVSGSPAGHHSREKRKMITYKYYRCSGRFFILTVQLTGLSRLNCAMLSW